MVYTILISTTKIRFVYYANSFLLVLDTAAARCRVTSHVVSRTRPNIVDDGLLYLTVRCSTPSRALWVWRRRSSESLSVGTW